jgi:N-acetylneuraminic acid mutarotase
MGHFIGTDLFQFGGFGGSFTIGTNKSSYLSATTGKWTLVDQLPNRQGISHMGTVVIGNKVYGCGGFLDGLGPNFKATAECHVYTHGNPTGSQWSRLPDLPAIRAGGGSLHNKARNSLIFATGADEKDYRRVVDWNNVWELSLDDIDAGWVSKSDIPYRANHVGAVTVDYQGTERHYVLGGQNGPREADGNYGFVYEFDAITDTWTPRANITIPTGHISASTVPYKNCGFFIMGGANNCRCKTSAIHYYDITTNTWHKIGDLPQAINSPVCDILNNTVYCIIRTRTQRRQLA